MYEDDQIRAYKASGLTNVKHKEAEKYLDKYMQILHGEWYDKNGNKQLTVEGRTINDPPAPEGFIVIGDHKPLQRK